MASFSDRNRANMSGPARQHAQQRHQATKLNNVLDRLSSTVTDQRHLLLALQDRLEAVEARQGGLERRAGQDKAWRERATGQLQAANERMGRLEQDQRATLHLAALAAMTARGPAPAPPPAPQQRKRRDTGTAVYLAPDGRVKRLHDASWQELKALFLRFNSPEIGDNHLMLPWRGGISLTRPERSPHFTKDDGSIDEHLRWSVFVNYIRLRKKLRERQQALGVMA
jgi:hypothetical protein